MRRFAAFMLLALFAVPAIFIAMGKDHSPSGPAPEPARTREAANPKRQAECQKLLDKMGRGRLPVYESWEQNGDVVRVHVMSAFYLATLKQKNVFNSIILCVAAEGRSEDRGITLVRYLDAYTGKRVALWGQSTGFKMTD